MGQCQSTNPHHHHPSEQRKSNKASHGSSLALGQGSSSASFQHQQHHQEHSPQDEEQSLPPSRPASSRCYKHNKPQRKHKRHVLDKQHHYASEPNLSYYDDDFEPNTKLYKDILLPLSLFQSSSTRSLQDIWEATYQERNDGGNRRQPFNREASNKRLRHKIESRRQQYQRQPLKTPEPEEPNTVIIQQASTEPFNDLSAAAATTTTTTDTSDATSNNNNTTTTTTRPQLLSKEDSWYLLSNSLHDSNASLDLDTATSHHNPTQRFSQSMRRLSSESWGGLSVHNKATIEEDGFASLIIKKKALDLSMNDVSGNTLSTRADEEEDDDESDSEDDNNNHKNCYIQKIKDMAHPEVRSTTSTMPNMSPLLSPSFRNLSSVGRSLSHKIFVGRPTTASCR